MDFGASTACYYPLETELAIDKIIEGGFSCTEIFFNTYSEIMPGFVSALAQKTRSAALDVVSVHPFSSFAETHCLFGDYPRRADDFIELYQHYFEACNILGASILVIHGALKKAKTSIPQERYMERYGKLAALGKSYGVTVAQENVYRHFSEDVSFLKKMKQALGNDFKLVLDVKQAWRAGYDPFDFVQAFASDIVHIHISDHDSEKDCIPPGKGTFNFARLKQMMDKAQYTGKYMVEIYREDYDVEAELAESKRFLSAMK